MAMDNRKHVDGCSLSSIPYEFASCGCLRAQAEVEALRGEIERLREALRTIDRMNDHPGWFRRALNDVLEAALSEPMP
jgi:hypothetical protein